MKKLLVIFLIFSLATISLASPLTDAEKLARKDAAPFATFLLAFGTGLVKPISPLRFLFATFDPPNENLEAVASYYGKDSIVTWHYIEAYRRIVKSTVLIGSLAGALFDILLISQAISAILN